MHSVSVLILLKHINKSTEKLCGNWGNKSNSWKPLSFCWEDRLNDRLNDWLIDWLFQLVECLCSGLVLMFLLYLEKSPTIERTKVKIQVFKAVAYVKYVFYTQFWWKRTLSPTKTDDAFNDGKKYVQQCFQPRVVNNSFL